MKTTDLITERFEGQGNSRVVRIRSNGTAIIETWSCWEGATSGAKMLCRIPADLLDLATRQAAGHLDPDEQDCRAYLSETEWLRDQEPIQILRTGHQVS